MTMMDHIVDSFQRYSVPVIITTIALLAGLIVYVFWPALAIQPQRNAREDDLHTVALSASTQSSASDDIQQQPLLTIVIPAYNEEERISLMLLDAYEYLAQPSCPALQTLATAYSQQQNSSSNTKPTTSRQQRQQHSDDDEIAVEWILVNDGSSDATISVYKEFIKHHCQPKASKTTTMIWKCLTLSRNSGKGAAVQAGMQVSQGKYCLFCDADGATKFRGLQACADAMLTLTLTEIAAKVSTNNTIGVNNDSVVVMGSRAHLQESSSVQRSAIRTMLMYGFHFLQNVLVGSGKIKDTQCGFKLFTASAARTCFHSLHLQRWAFDTELIYICHAAGLFMHEVAVDWTEVDGSKLHTSPWSLVVVSIQMFRDMLCVRLCYTLGIWCVAVSPPEAEMSKKKD